MSEKEKDIIRKLSPKRIIWPVLLGLGVATFLLISNLNDVRFEPVVDGMCGDYIRVGEGEVPDFSDKDQWEAVDNCEGTHVMRTYKDTLGDIDWGWHSTLWLVMALIAMATRDVAYMYRIRVLTDYELSWGRSFRVIMLWEFASALSPSIVGGSGIAMFILNREGIKLGKSTAIVLVSALLDELFYITMVAVVLLVVGTSNLFPVSMQLTLFGTTLGTKGIFWVGYIFIFLMTTAILVGIFFAPRSLKYLLLQIFRLPVLRRWR
ncbi:MAG: flippase-like domain-containing protein, partial [Flavobacteriales bacterium]|nr:flippase-like domain-containing protein [Flavobacteriales bacterium]